MVMHEFFAIAGTIVGGVIFISALNKKSDTANIIKVSSDGFGNLLGRISGANQ